jgi:starvation-inducible DNA-binding protein
MHPTHNTLSENIRTQSVELLNTHLAAAIDLHGQLKQAHWNVRGPAFIGVHELFDKVAGEAESYSDSIAERAAGLGGVAEGAVQVAVAATLSAFGQSARDAIGQSEALGDADTADLFTEISRGVDHQLWLVESHVAPK